MILLKTPWSWGTLLFLSVSALIGIIGLILIGRGIYSSFMWLSSTSLPLFLIFNGWALILLSSLSICGFFGRCLSPKWYYGLGLSVFASSVISTILTTRNALIIIRLQSNLDPFYASDVDLIRVLRTAFFSKISESDCTIDEGSLSYTCRDPDIERWFQSVHESTDSIQECVYNET